MIHTVSRPWMVALDVAVWAIWGFSVGLFAHRLPLRRLDVCKSCNSELHVCKMCVEYDTSYAKHCREPTEYWQSISSR